MSTYVLYVDASERLTAPLNAVLPVLPPSDPLGGIFHLLNLWVPPQSDFMVTKVFFW